METFSVLLALCDGNSPTVSLTKASDAELRRFLWSAEYTVEQTIETPVIWDAIALITTSLQWLLAVRWSRCRKCLPVKDNGQFTHRWQYRGWSLHWRHNGRDSVSNHQPYDCLLNRLFRRRSKKTSKLRVTGLCEGNSPGTGEFSAQMGSNAENFHLMTSSCDGLATHVFTYFFY